MRRKAVQKREVMLEAFTAGWQAALGVRITNPRVLDVVESCFELWLQDACEEREVLGLAFHGREDLPSPAWNHVPAWVHPEKEQPAARQLPWIPRQRRRRVASTPGSRPRERESDGRRQVGV